MGETLSRLTELIHPATYAQVEAYRLMGLRHRILTLDAQPLASPSASRAMELALRPRRPAEVIDHFDQGCDSNLQLSAKPGQLHPI